MRKSRAFTLIEVLIVVGIVVVLATVVALITNPEKRLARVNNAGRAAHVVSIMDAISQYAIDNVGSLPGLSLPLSLEEICRDGGNCNTLDGVNIDVLLEDYISRIPVDPNCNSCGDCDIEGTGYYIMRDPGTRMTTIEAKCAELDTTISIRR